MTTESKNREKDSGEEEADVMGLTPMQVAARAIGAALVLIVLVIVISVASKA